MVRNVNVALDDSDYETVAEVKDRHELTWEEFIIEAARCIDENRETTND